MWSTARRLLLTGVLVAGVAVPVSPALAQQPDLTDAPRLSTEPPASLRDRPAATPSPEPTPTAAATATPTAEATPAAATRPVRRGADLPNTGSDAQTLAFAGLSLLLLGASLRVQVVLRDGRV